MDIIAFGINHKTAPVDVREKFFLTPAQRDVLLLELKYHEHVLEALVLSTCNRTEIYAVFDDSMQGGENLLAELLRRTKDLDSIDLTHFYTYQNTMAVEHLFKVVTSLDSLVVGEKQILGQIKENVQRSRNKDAMGPVLNILTNVAVRLGKKAHSETDIGHGGSSVSWAAVNLAERQFASLVGLSVAIIGSGKMSELAAGQFKNKGIKDLFVMNRTHDHAVALAERLQATPVSFSEAREMMSFVDVVICSTGAPHYIVDRDLVEKVMISRNQRKFLLIDISVPRNIHPAVSYVPGVDLFSIDDLEQVVQSNLSKRQGAIEEVEVMISSKVNEFYKKLEKRGAC